MIFKKATIIGFYGSWSSGLATLKLINEKTKTRVDIPCDNGPTTRALNNIFDGFITKGHSVDNSTINGKKILYTMDDMGLVLGAILPEDYCSICSRQIDCDECPVEVE